MLPRCEQKMRTGTQAIAEVKTCCGTLLPILNPKSNIGKIGDSKNRLIWKCSLCLRVVD